MAVLNDPRSDRILDANYRKIDRTDRMNALIRLSIAAISCLAAQTATLLAADPAAPADNSALAAMAPRAGKPAITHHSIEINGELLRYVTRVAKIEITGEDEKPAAELFYVGYTAEADKSVQRPVTFVFNGGPGAASAYLHLLALGPRIVELNDDGSIPAPPVRMKDNRLTWLSFTDLVFIDPVGTGFSRAISSGDEKDRAQGQTFWSYNKDLDSLAEFIRLYLTRNGRWDSPKFLAGESYGGFRAAALPERLASDPGVRLNGVVLISPVLEFSLQETDAFRVLPWATLLPAYAAAAYRHGKLSEKNASLASVVADAEDFAMGRYLTWLSQVDMSGDASPPQELTKYLGLKPSTVDRFDGRVPRSEFSRLLLRDSDRLISLYDSSIAGINAHPARPGWHGGDPVLDGLTAPLTSALNIYVREQLEYETDTPYLVLNGAVGRHWNWQSKRRGRPQAPGVADDLKDAMSGNPDFKVFVAHGYYDLVTPYLASKYVLARMALDSAIAPNLTFKIYDGGHMLYMHASARAAFYNDVSEFFRGALASMR
jgi:carboxypeptidase C (cathepsin A)